MKLFRRLKIIFIVFLTFALFLSLRQGALYQNSNIKKTLSIKEETVINNHQNDVKTSTKVNGNNSNIIFSGSPLPQSIIKKINGVSWKESAPVKLSDLSYLKVTYWGFDDKSHIGELIVHKNVAKEVVEIFKELYEAKFPIEKIRLIDEYDGDDNLSMEDNNTSAFCYRVVSGTNKLSKHSYGIAIDINPIQNPYVKDGRVSPKSGEEYLNRNNVRKGMIIKGDACYNAFRKRGWIWGGEWKTLKDYQHFEKKMKEDGLWN